jgi:hypothetical protein
MNHQSTRSVLDSVVIADTAPTDSVGDRMLLRCSIDKPSFHFGFLQRPNVDS